MKLEAVAKYFSPKSTLISDSPAATARESLCITEVMAALGMTSSRAAVGLELYLAKVGVMGPDLSISYLTEYCRNKAISLPAVKKMSVDSQEHFFHAIGRYAFEDYSRSAASRKPCVDCDGGGFINAQVFTTKVTHPDGKPPKWASTTKGVFPSYWEVCEERREQVRVLCKTCNGKGSVDHSCRCHGRGKVLDRKTSEIQGVPVMKDCDKCNGRGYSRLCEAEIYSALAIPKTTWQRNFKPLFEQLIEVCHIEESYAERELMRVTK